MVGSKKILLVEDEVELSQEVAKALQKFGYQVEVTLDGIDGQARPMQEHYDTVILDLGLLPRIDGLTILEQWRRDGMDMPVIILSSRDTWREKVAGLRSGADDYLAKPFAMEELLARVEVLVRRQGKVIHSVIILGPLWMNTEMRQLRKDGHVVALTAMEYRLMHLFMSHPGKFFSRQELGNRLYSQGNESDSNTIEVLIGRLRKKIGIEWIRNHRGLGYQLIVPETIVTR